MHTSEVQYLNSLGGLLILIRSELLKTLISIIPFCMRKLYCLAILSLFIFSDSYSQSNSGDSTTAAAGPQYKRSGWHNFLWGKNYRTVWSTPVTLKKFFFDKEAGGLKIDELGGGHQTKSLHLEIEDGKKYTLRSVDKTLGKVLPEEFLGTWIEDLVNDEVSMSNPYGALTVPPMAKASDVYHTHPEIMYLPDQPELDTFKNLPNEVYLFEKRVKGNWENADNLGNFPEYYGTYEVIDKLKNETEYRIDQRRYLRSRLFDMVVGDWDRHEDQWEWGERKQGNWKMLVPVPQDRDQIYSTHDGLLLSLAIGASGLGYFQPYKKDFKKVEIFNYEERGTDRLFTNQLSRADWQSIADTLKATLTDEVIEKGMHQLPPEIFAISGLKLAEIVKARRDQIPGFAMQYYDFLAKEVEVIGTKGTEYFDISPQNDGKLLVQLFNKTKDDKKKSFPFYERTFDPAETKEVRLYGIGDKDVFTVNNNQQSDIRVRLIGGEAKDSFLLQNARLKTFVYDDNKNIIEKTGSAKLRLNNDSAVHAYEFRNFQYDKKGIKPTLFYSDADRFYVGLGYGWTHHKWRKKPFAFKQTVGINYSISQSALSFFYKGLFPEAIGKLDLSLAGMYDLVRWTNFYGFGNETILTTKDRNYNRMRSKELLGSIGLEKKLKHNKFTLMGFFNTVEIINDEDRFTAKILAPADSTVFNQNRFAGATFLYQLSLLNNDAVPTAGVKVTASASFTQNLEAKNNFMKYIGNVQVYIPLFSPFSLAITSGVATVTGDPLFYQYPEIGGGMNLRGFQRQRFYGKTAFFNSNELRFLPKIKSYLMNGHLGLLAFVDDGRVWVPGEDSNTWHVGYGGGVLIAPFDKVLADITYGISKEDRLIQFRFNLTL